MENINVYISETFSSEDFGRCSILHRELLIVPRVWLYFDFSQLCFPGFHIDCRPAACCGTVSATFIDARENGEHICAGMKWNTVKLSSAAVLRPWCEHYTRVDPKIPLKWIYTIYIPLDLTQCCCGDSWLRVKNHFQKQPLKNTIKAKFGASFCDITKNTKYGTYVFLKQDYRMRQRFGFEAVYFWGYMSGSVQKS